MNTCPCCGQPVEGSNIVTVVAMLPFAGIFKKILAALARTPGQFVHIDRLAQLVYASDPHGGPEMANRSLHVTVSRNRSKLEGTGLALDSRIGRRGGYRLRWADVDESRAAA